MFHQVEETGINALPIVGLLSFLIGVVLAYQGADQLKRFGAEIFTINLLGVGMLREIGGLITAIIVAGRSGSAFTAQIGTMRVNEEIDAMQTMGLNTVDTLVLPRIIGLVDRPAAADLLCRHHGPDRRRRHVLFPARHHHSRLPAPAPARR